MESIADSKWYPPVSPRPQCPLAVTLCPSVFCRRRAQWSAFTPCPAPACCCSSWLTVCGWRACCSASASACWGSTSLFEPRPRAMKWGAMRGPANVTLLLRTGQTSVRTALICLSKCFTTLWRTWICIFNFRFDDEDDDDDVIACDDRRYVPHQWRFLCLPWMCQADGAYWIRTFLVTEKQLNLKPATGWIIRTAPHVPSRWITRQHICKYSLPQLLI